MDIKKLIQDYGTIAMWVINGAIAAYVWQKKILFNQEIPDIAVYAALGASLYIFNTMKKELNALFEANTELKKLAVPRPYPQPQQQPVYPQQPLQQYPPQPSPFDFPLGKP